MKNIYLKYDVVQLAQDADFIQWARHTDGAADAEWQAWLERHPGQKEKIEEAKRLVNSLRFTEPEISDARKDALWEKIEQSTIPEQSLQRRLPRWSRWAAAAIFIFVLGLFFYGESTGRLKANSYAGKQQQVQLPDGSVALLNASSSISYRSTFWSRKRLVQLEGEAFFEVEKGKPFIVQSPQGKIEVLGTSFNVDSYDGHFEVICYTGKVSVSSENNTVVLEPGEATRLKDGKLESSVFDSPVKEGWRAGYFEYENTPLREVFAEFERQFAVEIQAPDSILERKYTGFYYNNQLDSALQLITWPLNLEASKSGGVIRVEPAE
jgi:ferric-dicitrate binding protein FerR (iron transport regulator)